MVQLALLLPIAIASATLLTAAELILEPNRGRRLYCSP